jgi:hypothetical protein
MKPKWRAMFHCSIGYAIATTNMFGKLLFKCCNLRTLSQHARAKYAIDGSTFIITK